MKGATTVYVLTLSLKGANITNPQTEKAKKRIPVQSKNLSKSGSAWKRVLGSAYR